MIRRALTFARDSRGKPRASGDDPNIEGHELAGDQVRKPRASGDDPGITDTYLLSIE